MKYTEIPKFWNGHFEGTTDMIVQFVENALRTCARFFRGTYGIRNRPGWWHNIFCGTLWFYFRKTTTFWSPPLSFPTKVNTSTMVQKPFTTAFFVVVTTLTTVATTAQTLKDLKDNMGLRAYGLCQGDCDQDSDCQVRTEKRTDHNDARLIYACMMHYDLSKAAQPAATGRSHFWFLCHHAWSPFWLLLLVWTFLFPTKWNHSSSWLFRKRYKKQWLLLYSTCRTSRYCRRRWSPSQCISTSKVSGRLWLGRWLWSKCTQYRNGEVQVACHIKFCLYLLLINSVLLWHRWTAWSGFTDVLWTNGYTSGSWLYGYRPKWNGLLLRCRCNYNDTSGGRKQWQSFFSVSHGSLPRRLW